MTTAARTPFARKTFESAHAPARQIAMVDRGRLVWSAAYGLRRRDPGAAMDRDTTTVGGAITKGVFGTYVSSSSTAEISPLDTPIVRALEDHQLRPLSRVGHGAWWDGAGWPTVTPRCARSYAGSTTLHRSNPKENALRFQPAPSILFRRRANLVKFVIEQQKGRPLDQRCRKSYHAGSG